MTYNTPENRAAFVAKFGFQPEGDYSAYPVNEVTAQKILDGFDRLGGEWMTEKGNLASFIMQDRKSFMLAQQHINSAKAAGIQVGNKRYEQITERVARDVIAFVASLT